jgi:hypothetical protein
MRCGGSSAGRSVNGTGAAQETRWRQCDDRHGPTADIALVRHFDRNTRRLGVGAGALAALAHAASRVAAHGLYPAGGMDATEPRARRRQPPHLDGHALELDGEYN